MSIPISSEIAREIPKAKGPRVRQSKFIITANTNTRPNSVAERQTGIRILEHAAEELFKSTEDLEQIVIFTNREHSWSPRYVLSASSRHSAEMGKTRVGGRLHVHSALTIRHLSCIRISPIKIKELLNRRLESAGSVLRIQYVNVRYVRDDSAVLEYLDKDIPAPLEEDFGKLSL